MGATDGVSAMAPASITAIADRLEAKRLLMRLPHPDDGRRVLLAADPSAYERLAPLYTDLAERLIELYRRFDEGQLEFLARVFADTAEAQQAATDALTRNAGDGDGS